MNVSRVILEYLNGLTIPSSTICESSILYITPQASLSHSDLASITWDVLNLVRKRVNLFGEIPPNIMELRHHRFASQQASGTYFSSLRKRQKTITFLVALVLAHHQSTPQLLISWIQEPPLIGASRLGILFSIT